MAAHAALFDVHNGSPLPDPGASGTITVDRSPCFVALVTAAAEARTLARPTREGAIVTLHFKTDAGDLTLTVTGGYNEAGDTTYVFTDAGQFLSFIACYDGTSYFWRLLAHSADAPINQSEIVITTNVLTAAESGKTFYLNLAGGFTTTLPAPAVGLYFRFIVKTAPTTSYVITTNGGADILYGMMLERAGTAGVAGAARDTFNFVANQSIIGDWAEFHSDGTNWYYHGMVDVAAGNTVAAT